jgi:flagellar assembly protein FliH
MSYLAREDIGEVRRWQVPDVGDVAAKPAPPSLKTLRQLEDVEQRAREDGYAAGLAEGRAAARAEIAAEVARIQSIVAAIAAPFANLDASVESELVLLATTAATRIVRHELSLAPDRILGAVRDALAALPAYARNVKLFLAPDDAALVREHMTAATSGHAYDIVEDSSLTRGGCRVMADTSQVDATLETRLATIIDAMLGGDAADAR